MMAKEHDWIVRTEALTRVYRVGAWEVNALQDISLEVAQGRFVALDSVTGQEILALFRRFVEHEGTTVLMATHDLTVDLFADQVVHLQDGCVVQPEESEHR
jgi:ABC-type lipoprotein export system ATPase subunit